MRLFLPAFQAEAGVTPPVSVLRIPILEGATPQLRLRTEIGPDDTSLSSGKPVIAIVIDDLGADVAHYETRDPAAARGGAGLPALSGSDAAART